MTSPTFTIGHVLGGSPEVAHLDLYRLGSLAGEDPALLDDYLTPERVAFVEWPAVGEPAFERVAARVLLEHLGGDRRRRSTSRVTLLGIDTSTPGQRRLRAARRRRELRGGARARAPGRAARRTPRELMPAIASVMERGRGGLRRARGDRGGGRAGDLHGAAHRHRHGARARERRRPARCGRCRRSPRSPRASRARLRLALIDARRGEVFARALRRRRRAALAALRGRARAGRRAGAGGRLSRRGRPATGRYDFGGCSRPPE